MKDFYLPISKKFTDDLIKTIEMNLELLVDIKDDPQWKDATAYTFARTRTLLDLLSYIARGPYTTYKVYGPRLRYKIIDYEHL